MRKSVLLINDLPGYGRAALSLMLPVLSRMGFHVYNLPTALVSNTLDYGKFEILETTDYMKNTLLVWEELGFRFDAVSAGFFVSEGQMALTAGFCKEQKEKSGTKLFVDPIMGDKGKFYHGVTKQSIAGRKQLVAEADYIVPNYTEACFLTGLPYRASGMTKKESDELLAALKHLSKASIAVTSVKVEGQDAVLGYDREADKSFLLPFSPIPAHFFGTGDIFSSVLMGKVLQGLSLQESTQKAMDAVQELIVGSEEIEEKYKGIPVELLFERIDR